MDLEVRSKILIIKSEAKMYSCSIGAKFAQIKSKWKVITSSNRSTFIGGVNTTNSIISKCQNEPSIKDNKGNFANSKQNANNARLSTKRITKPDSQKKNRNNQQINSKRLTMDYVIIESKSKENSKIINNTSRNTQRLSEKMNRFSNSLAETDNNIVQHSV